MPKIVHKFSWRHLFEVDKTLLSAANIPIFLVTNSLLSQSPAVTSNDAKQMRYSVVAESDLAKLTIAEDGTEATSLCTLLERRVDPNLQFVSF